MSGIIRPAESGKPKNAARDGWSAKNLAEYFTQYAKDNPDAVVEFTSCESGGYWPKDKVAMGVFVDDQVRLVDSTLCGGGVVLNISLIAFGKEDGV